jgi:hypothetical protein
MAAGSTAAKISKTARSDELHFIALKVLRLRAELFEAGCITEELLHFAGRTESDRHAPKTAITRKGHPRRSKMPHWL